MPCLFGSEQTPNPVTPMILALATFAFIIFLFASNICLEIDDWGKGRVEWCLLICFPFYYKKLKLSLLLSKPPVRVHLFQKVTAYCLLRASLAFGYPRIPFILFLHFSMAFYLFPIQLLFSTEQIWS